MFILYSSDRSIILQKLDLNRMEERYFESNSLGLIQDLRKELHILRQRERELLQTISSIHFKQLFILSSSQC